MIPAFHGSRTHGGSGAHRKTWGIDGFVADVRAVVDAAGVGKFTLVGRSMSGPIAIETAKQLGDRVTGVVPVDTLLDADEQMPTEQRTTLIARVRTDYRGFIEEAVSHLVSRSADPEVVARVTADALANDAERMVSILEWVFSYPAGRTLDQLAMPIIAIDSDLRPVALDHDRAHAPQFDVRVIKDTGHWLMLDKPREFAATLREVVESIESGKAKRRSL